MADDAAVQIFTAGGALLHSTTVAEVSNITLPRGVYLVQVSGVTKKVVL
ncbi:MAG: T9SS type A sorting domain-containing protein [Bacteroidaceae bacterium]|nr:T9SS type A sorting domain-containing protein [Bacteroidaceae bacterium]